MSNVKLILNENVEKLGEVGDIVAVRSGYARNYLLPNRLATLPFPGEIKRIAKKKKLIEEQYQKEKAEAEELAKKVENHGPFVFLAKAGEAGKLFGTVTAKEITEKINSEVEIKIQRKQVLLKRALNELGDYEVKIKLHNEVQPQVKIVIKNAEE